MTTNIFNLSVNSTLAGNDIICHSIDKFSMDKIKSILEYNIYLSIGFLLLFLCYLLIPRLNKNNLPNEYKLTFIIVLCAVYGIWICYNSSIILYFYLNNENLTMSTLIPALLALLFPIALCYIAKKIEV